MPGRARSRRAHRWDRLSRHGRAPPPRRVHDGAVPQRHAPEGGYATVSLRTKKIEGLHENDCIMAAKLDRLASGVASGGLKAVGQPGAGESQAVRAEVEFGFASARR